ncbi:MAG: hypothetical protein OXB88_06975 [Bacteriovoracales bacterium]|nr:hypothetical protein [Bacteriovoracales bacterium]
MDKQPAPKNLKTESKKDQEGESYESIIKTLAKIKGFVMLTVISGIAFQSLLLATEFYLGGKEEQRHLSPLEVCYLGMNSIVRNAPDEDLLDKTTLRDATAKVFDFEKIVRIEMTGELRCDVILHDRKRGPRLFGVVLQKDESFPRFYRIRDAVEKNLP